ncbi:hypothetical protein LP419_26955 [Massilia sp. H-1]|nr:hypothetical protein LP419_26955 [Massilia sp. H-1]
MIDDKGNPRTLEFNCRMGDPETQPIMARLKSDLVGVMEHACNGTLDQVELEWDRRTAVGVVMAAAKLSGQPAQGRRDRRHSCRNGRMRDLPHLGTTQVQGTLQTSGGRVLCVVGLGDSVRMAQKQAYETLDQIHFNGAQFRRDIGWRGLKH